MKLKDGVSKKESMEFWYDITIGGYIVPEELLDSQGDINKVYEAINILQEFEEICVEAI